MRNAIGWTVAGIIGTLVVACTDTSQKEMAVAPEGKPMEDVVVSVDMPDTAEIAATGKKRQEIASFSPASLDRWLRPWKIRYSLEYLSEGFTGEGVELTTLAVYKADGRTQGLTPTVRNMNWPAETTYRFNATEDWKKIDIDVDFQNTIPEEVKIKTKPLSKAGKVSARNWHTGIVYRPMHRLSGGEIKLGYGNLLKHVFFDTIGMVRVEIAYPEKLTRAVTTVRDELGKTIFARETATVDLIELKGLGYYEIEVAALYNDGFLLKTTGSAVVLGKAMNEDEIRDSRFGMMVVNGGTKSFTRSIGGYWDWRFFFHGKDNQHIVGPDDSEGAIYAGHSSITFPKAMDPKNIGKGGLWPAKNWDVQREETAKWLKQNPYFAGKRLCFINEPDFKWMGTIPEMVLAHRIFSEEVHKRYPDAEVQGPACSRALPKYLKSLGDEGFFNFIDAVNIHAYVDSTMPESEFIENLRESVGVVRKEFNCKKPIYITEFGWTTVDGTWQTPVKEYVQARYLTRSYAIVASEDIKGAVWFCDYYIARNYGEGGFSILRLGNECTSPKPAVAAFMTLTRNLSDLQGNMRLIRISPTGWVATGLKKSGERVTLAWMQEGESEFEVPSGASRAEDYLGRPVPLAGKITISESPVYIFGGDEYDGVEWKEPSAEELKSRIKRSANEQLLHRINRGWQARDSLKDKPVIDAKYWTGDAKKMPQASVSYSMDGIIFNVDVYDEKHEQPYSQERLQDGDSVTIAIDINGGEEWQPNAHITSFKGHHAYEYTFALTDKGKKETFLRNAWDFDVTPNTPVQYSTRMTVTRLKNNVTRYMIWVTYVSIGMRSMPILGKKLGIAISVNDLTNGKLKRYNMFGGIDGTPNPMKYGLFVCVAEASAEGKTVEAEKAKEAKKQDE